jgi:redox-sensing transcriptional repressor
VKTSIPDATVQRLPLYLQCLEALPGSRRQISSEELAARAGVNAANVRKDLSHLGCLGVRGVGYVVSDLRVQIRATLGLVEEWRIVIVGIGDLGRALANFGGFGAQGFRVVGLFDSDPDKIGGSVGGVSIEPIEALAGAVREREAAIGVITTPAAVAQDVADLLAEAGISSILNFAPVVIRVPSDIEVRRVDFSNELRVLSYHLHRREIGGRSASA